VHKTKWLSLTLGMSVMIGTMVVVGGSWTTPAAQSGPGTGIIQGTVKSADGKVMEGVLVSARASDKSFTTSVFTDLQGKYVFPPLDGGQYKTWAQAKGFHKGQAEFALASGKVDRNFTLTPMTNVTEIVRQLSGTEMTASLPQTTPEDKRGLRIYNNSCAGCHTASWTLQNRWDEAGWGIIIDLMSKTGSDGQAPRPETKGNVMMLAYRDELAKYLGRVRGATELKRSDIKLNRRPTGDAANVVITEFDLPRPDGVPIHAQQGSDWEMGTPARYVGRGVHDVWADGDGNIWMADDLVPKRTIAKLDPKTGKVTDYDFKDPAGKTISTHSVVVDAKGKVWATNGNDGTFIMYDPKTDQFKNFMRQPGVTQRVGGTLEADSQGNPWGSSTGGALRLDVATGEYKFFAAPPLEGGRICGAECGSTGTYGITVDGQDNAWFTQPGVDRIVKADPKTGKTTAVLLEGHKVPEAIPVDQERAAKVRGSQNSGSLLSVAPRRNAADKNGNYVWTGLFHANRLNRLDTKTLQVKDYEMPTPHSMPYATAVDKNGTVWINTISGDVLTKFDPKTERFTEYPLPTLGTEIRHVQVDNRTDPPTVYAPSNRVNKVFRLQFRTAGTAQRASR